MLAVALLGVLTASPAEGDGARASSCGVQAFSYAGLQADRTAHGISATLDSTAPPSVSDGHVGGWIGLGGPGAGPGGVAEWLQVGLAAFPGQQTMQMYYEVTVAGSAPRYVELASRVTSGVRHKFAVLEMLRRKTWWRVWVDGKAASPPIYLPGSHGTWYPQAIAESWNGGDGACNTFGYRFADVSLASADGGTWRPMQTSYVFQDAGYEVVPISSHPRTFIATSLNY